MEKFLDKVMRFTISGNLSLISLIYYYYCSSHFIDGRIVQGILKSIDNSMNVILSEAFSIEPVNNKVQPLALIMIPGEHILKAELSKSS